MGDNTAFLLVAVRVLVLIIQGRDAPPLTQIVLNHWPDWSNGSTFRSKYLASTSVPGGKKRCDTALEVDEQLDTIFEPVRKHGG